MRVSVVWSAHAPHTHDHATATRASGAWSATHPREPGAAALPMTRSSVWQAGGCVRHPWHDDAQTSPSTTNGALPMRSGRRPGDTIVGHHPIAPCRRRGESFGVRAC
jgi:hypothetical protein